MSQQLRSSTFTPADADSFFLRNRQNLTEPRDDIALPLLRMYGIRPRYVLDVGTANGYRLADICRDYDSEGVGVDVSEVAIADARKHYPQMSFHVTSADALPASDYDLVTAIFVFHWIERRCLFESVAEIDRVLAPGGYLLLADFAPDHPEVVPYKHRQGVFTYKQPYHELFTAGLGYRLVAYLEFDHDSRELRPDVPSNDRAFKALLRKKSAD